MTVSHRITYVASGVDLGIPEGGAYVHVVETVHQLLLCENEVTLVGLATRTPEFAYPNNLGTPSSVPWIRQVINGLNVVLRARRDWKRRQSVAYVRWGTEATLVGCVAYLTGRPYWIEVNGIYCLMNAESTGVVAACKRSLLHWMEGWVLRRAAGVFTTTDAMAQYLIDCHGLDSKTVFTNPCGVNLRTHQLAAISDESSSPVIGFAGGLGKQNGVSLLVKSAPMILQAFPMARFKIIGGGTDAAKVRAMVSSLALDSHFDFVGSVPFSSVSELLADVDVAVAPYQDNPNLSTIGGGTPQKVSTYLACGKLTIISDLSYYQHYRSCSAVGFFAPGDAEDLAAKVVQFLHLSPAKRRERQSAARNYVATHFSWQDHASVIVEALSKYPAGERQ